MPETMTQSNAATSNPTNAAAAQQAAPEPQSSVQDAADDAFFDKLGDGSQNATEADGQVGDGEDDGSAEADDAGKNPANAATGQPVEFNADEQTLLSRFKLDPKSPTLLSLNPADRVKFLENLRGRQSYDDRAGQEKSQLRRENEELQRQLAELKKKPEPDAASQQQQTPAPLDDLWKAVGESIYDEKGLPTATRAAVDATVQQHLKSIKQAPDLTQQLGMLGRMLEELHFEQGVGDWQPPEGVDKNDAAIRRRIRDEASLVYDIERSRQGDKFDPFGFTLRHATQRAASLLFNQQTTAAANKDRAAQSRRSRQGSPESGARGPTGRTELSQEQKDDEWFAKHGEKSQR